MKRRKKDSGHTRRSSLLSFSTPNVQKYLHDVYGNGCYSSVHTVAVHAIPVFTLLLCMLFQCSHCCCACYSSVHTVAVHVIPVFTLLLCMLFQCSHCFCACYFSVHTVSVHAIPVFTLLLCMLLQCSHCCFACYSSVHTVAIHAIPVFSSHTKSPLMHFLHYFLALVKNLL
jgi:hypothetical protein